MKIVNLTKNEIIKQYKKKSIVIITAIILLTAIILPFLGGISVKKNEINYTQQNIKQMLEVTNVELKENAKDKSLIGKAKRIALEGEKAYYDLGVKAELESEDWKEKSLENYRDVYVEMLVIEALNNGLSKEIILNYGSSFNPEYVEKVANLNIGARNKELERVKKEVEIEKNIILKKDYFKYLERKVERLDNTVKGYKKNLTAIDKELVKKSNNQETLNEIKRFKGLIERDNIAIKLDKFRLENKVEFNKEEWRNKTLKNLEKLIEEYRTPMLKEQEFLVDGTFKGSYEQYKKYYESNKEITKEKIEKDWYSLKNNIPELQFIKDARTELNKNYNIYIILAVFLVIIIGGGIVANEFSTGTIRLLAIRPIKRWKLLLSKYLGVLVIGIGVFAISTIILAISSGIAYGFSGYEIPVLETVNGAVKEGPFIIFVLANIGISLVSLIFIITLVFCISVVAKNTALAVGIGMITYFGSVFLTTMISGKLLERTPIPYIGESVINLASGIKDILSRTSGVEYIAKNGLVSLVILIIVMLIASFVIFTKKDIRN